MAKLPHIPPLVGRDAAARMLRMPPTNMKRNLGDELPPPLQERMPGVIEVDRPMWLRSEIQVIADRLADRQHAEESRRAQAATDRHEMTRRVVEQLSDEWRPGPEIARAAGVPVRGIGRRLSVLEQRGLAEALRDDGTPLHWRRAR